jgi:hypothetical protein
VLATDVPYEQIVATQFHDLWETIASSHTRSGIDGRAHQENA